MVNKPRLWRTSWHGEIGFWECIHCHQMFDYSHECPSDNIYNIMQKLLIMQGLLDMTKEFK